MRTLVHWTFFRRVRGCPDHGGHRAVPQKKNVTARLLGYIIVTINVIPTSYAYGCSTVSKTCAVFLIPMYFCLPLVVVDARRALAFAPFDGEPTVTAVYCTVLGIIHGAQRNYVAAEYARAPCVPVIRVVFIGIPRESLRGTTLLSRRAYDALPRRSPVPFHPSADYRRTESRAAFSILTYFRFTPCAAHTYTNTGERIRIHVQGIHV